MTMYKSKLAKKSCFLLTKCVHDQSIELFSLKITSYNSNTFKISQYALSLSSFPGPCCLCYATLEMTAALCAALMRPLMVQTVSAPCNSLNNSFMHRTDETLWCKMSLIERTNTPIIFLIHCTSLILHVFFLQLAKIYRTGV